MTLNNKKILIIIGGGIAAYKSLDLIRLLRKESVEIKTIQVEWNKLGQCYFVRNDLPISLSLENENEYI